MNKKSSISILVVTLIAIAGLLSILMPTNESEVHAASPSLSDYANKPGAEITLHVLGPVVANEFYRSADITISPSFRTITAYKTYNNEVLATTTYGNNQNAFTQFVNALQVSNFSTTPAKDSQSEVKSTCPQGARYVYELRDEGKTITQLWATSCSTKNQSFKGNAPLANMLFRDQIPGISQMPDYKEALQ